MFPPHESHPGKCFLKNIHHSSILICKALLVCVQCHSSSPCYSLLSIISRNSHHLFYAPIFSCPHVLLHSPTPSLVLFSWPSLITFLHLLLYSFLIHTSMRQLSSVEHPWKSLFRPKTSFLLFSSFFLFLYLHCVDDIIVAFRLCWAIQVH